jgi:hypothetical protein
MFRRILTGLIFTFLISFAAMNFSSRYSREPEGVVRFTLSEGKPVFWLAEIIRQTPHITEKTRQNQDYSRILPSCSFLKASSRKPELKNVQSFLFFALAKETLSLNLLEFHCRLNI